MILNVEKLDCLGKCNYTSLRSEIPLLKNMMDTAINLTVISGLRIPLQI